MKLAYGNYTISKAEGPSYVFEALHRSTQSLHSHEHVMEMVLGIIL